MAFLVFVVFATLAYQNTLDAPFYFDDIPNIVKNPSVHLKELNVKSIGEVMSTLKGFSRRPVAHLSFALNYYVSQLDVTGYRLVNIAVHTLAGFFLFLLLDLSFKLGRSCPSGLACIQQTESTKSLSANPSFITGLAILLWLTHPVQTQSVTYIVQRMTSMAGMFYIASLWLYVKGRMADRTWKRWPYFAGCALAWVAALGSKEIAITLPAFVLLYEWYFFQDLNKDWLKRAFPYVAGTLLLLLTIVVLYWGGGNPWTAVLSGYSQWDFSLAERLLTECRVVIYYVSLIIFPHPDRLSVNYDFALSHSLVAPVTTLFSLVTILGLTILAIALAKKERLFSFAILWFLGHLVIESSVIPLDLVFEHRLYLPTMFIFVFVPILLTRLFRRDLWVIGSLSCLVALLLVGTYQRNSVWSDPLAFSQDSVSKSPQSPRSHNWLGLSLAEKGAYEEAIVHYMKALQLEPDFAPAHNNWALALVELERYEEAITHYKIALRIRPRYPRALYGMGVAYMRKGDNEKALKRFSAAVRINPNYAEALNQMGYLLAKKGNIDEAISHLSMALNIKPEYGSAHYNMAVALASKGEVDGAISHYKKALEAIPEYAEAHNNLGILLARQGRLDEAAAHFAKALEIDPEFVKAKKNLERAKVMMR